MHPGIEVYSGVCLTNPLLISAKNPTRMFELPFKRNY